MYHLLKNKGLRDIENTNAGNFPILEPQTSNYSQAFIIEMFVTFIFVYSVLLVKDVNISVFHDEGVRVAGSKVNWFGWMTIALSLSAMIFVAGPHTGASINPAVSVAQ
jgi:glycerol uptake facilitator-like aquaporin